MEVKILNFNKSDKDIIDHYIQKNSFYFDKINSGFVFLYLPDAKINSRVLLRETLMKNPQSKLIVSGNNSVANLAWKIEAFGFLESPVNEDNIQTVINKINKTAVIKKDIIKLTYNSGFDLIDPNDICFIKGAGNYIEIYLKNSNKKLYTYQLKEIDNILRRFPYIIRIGKSFIVNINRISKLENNFIKLRCNTALQIKLSKLYIRKIKEILLWYI